MKKIAIRLDAGKSIGLGHLMRCMSLAEMLEEEEGMSVIFICRNKLHVKIGYDVVYLDKEYVIDAKSYDFPSICDELDEMKKNLRDRHIDCLIVDHYGAEDEYYEQLRDSVSLFICIDDGMERHIPVDVIINGNIYAVGANYMPAAVQLLGGEYTLLRSEFIDSPKRFLRKEIRDIYITSGGADPLQFCKTIVDVLETMPLDIVTHVIVGVDFEPDYVEQLATLDVVIHRNADMRKCMLGADLFVSAAGSTLYELAVTGTPSISYILADDQIRVAEKMWEKNCSISGGRFSKFQPQEFEALIYQLMEFDTRKKISEIAQKTIQSGGAMKIARKIGQLLDNNMQ